MTAEEWKLAEKTLKDFFEEVVFEIDGYEVSVTLMRVSVYKNALAVFVNGKFEGKWLVKGTDECQRFYPRKERPLISAKKMAELKKEFRLTKKQCEEHNPKVVSHSTHWTSFAAMKRHFIANNRSIRLVRPTMT